MNVQALSEILCQNLEAACSCGDLYRMEAAHSIAAKEQALGIAGLFRIIRHDPIDFLMVAASGFDGDLKIATGLDRDQWLGVVS